MGIKSDSPIAYFPSWTPCIDVAKSLDILRTEVSQDADWRVQEILTKAFDRFCADVGYEKAFPVIEGWLVDPSVRILEHPAVHSDNIRPPLFSGCEA